VYRKSQPAAVRRGVLALLQIAMGLFLLAAAVPETEPQAAVPRADPGPDFNRDGFADLAVGIPYEDDGAVEDAGAVQVIYGSRSGLNGKTPLDDLFLTQSDYGETTTGSERNDHFGYALAAGDFDGDRFDDLAIGVPNKDAVPVPGKNVVNAGAVFVLKGSRAGLRPAYRLRQSSRAIPARAEPGDHFGFSLAAGDFGRGRSDDLAVGVPDEDDDRRHENTGAVNVIYGSRAGLGTQKGQVALTYAFHSGARWGFSLAAADFGHGTPQDELAVGGPFSRLGPLYAEAGIVWVLIGGPRGLNVDPIANIALYHPGAYGPALGVTEAGDHFGYALAAADFGRGRHADLAIGVPGDGKGNTGSVVVLYSTSGIRAERAQLWKQGRGGVVGKPHTGDYFGHALAAADFGKGETADLAIGVPEDKGKVGGVNILFGRSDGLNALGNGFVWQSGSSFEGDVEGDSERWDRFGAALAGADFGRGGKDDLVIGVPKEDKESLLHGDKLSVGGVNVLYGDASGPRWNDDQFWWQASDSLHDSGEEGDEFGTVFAR
jgi:hypothetical protein